MLQLQILSTLCSIGSNSTKVFPQAFVKKLKEIYGEDNVIKVGELGSKRDTKDGVDCEIIINGEVLTAQIKPFLNAEDIGENFKMHNTGNVKPYKTNFIIFSTG